MSPELDRVFSDGSWFGAAPEDNELDLASRSPFVLILFA